MSLSTQQCPHGWCCSWGWCLLKDTGPRPSCDSGSGTTVMAEVIVSLPVEASGTPAAAAVSHLWLLHGPGLKPDQKTRASSSPTKRIHTLKRILFLHNWLQSACAALVIAVTSLNFFHLDVTFSAPHEPQAKVVVWSLCSKRTLIAEWSNSKTILALNMKPFVLDDLLPSVLSSIAHQNPTRILSPSFLRS